MASSCSMPWMASSSMAVVSKKRKKEGTGSDLVTVLARPLPFFTVFFTVFTVRSLPSFQWISLHKPINPKKENV